MLIRYLLVGDPGRGSGVWRKICAQTGRWAAEGHEVEIMMPVVAGAEPGPGPEGVTIRTMEVQRRRVAFGLVDLARRTVPADLLYARFSPWRPGWNTLLAPQPSVCEVPANPTGQYRRSSLSDRVRWRATARRTFRHVDGLVILGEDTIDGLPEPARRLPVAVVGDGIDLASVPELAPAPPGPPTLLYLGQNGPWHGVDQLIRAAAIRPDWRIELVGVGDTVGPVTDNVTVHPWLEPSAFQAIAARCRVAVGPLELFRIGLRQMSPLKTREYLAMGLPTIIGYEDTDFPEGSPWLLQLPPEPGALLADLDRVEAFLDGPGRLRVPRSAVAHLDSVAKERDRLRFLERIAASETRLG